LLLPSADPLVYLPVRLVVSSGQAKSYRAETKVGS